MFLKEIVLFWVYVIEYFISLFLSSSPIPFALLIQKPLALSIAERERMDRLSGSPLKGRRRYRSSDKNVSFMGTEFFIFSSLLSSIVASGF